MSCQRDGLRCCFAAHKQCLHTQTGQGDTRKPDIQKDRKAGRNVFGGQKMG